MCLGSICISRTKLEKVIWFFICLLYSKSQSDVLRLFKAPHWCKRWHWLHVCKRNSWQSGVKQKHLFHWEKSSISSFFSKKGLILFWAGMVSVVDSGRLPQLKTWWYLTKVNEKKNIQTNRPKKNPTFFVLKIPLGTRSSSCLELLDSSCLRCSILFSQKGNLINFKILMRCEVVFAQKLFEMSALTFANSYFYFSWN